MNHPIIAINAYLSASNESTQFTLERQYVDVVLAAGGVPLILPLMQTAAEVSAGLERADGLILSGGDDIRARRWGERNHPKTNLLHPEKEEADFRLWRAAELRHIPTLAICYGMQLVNVARGGSVEQHLPAHAKRTKHPVLIEPGSRLHRIMGRSARVNSHHHQAVGRLGQGLRVSARADDDVIEAIEDHGERFVIGVQWHPERMGRSASQRRLMRAFVRACSA